jgi:acetolactate synthase-1/2/3 large subunit
LVDALAEGLSGRPGPVFIEIPLDVQNQAADCGEGEIAAAADEVRARIAAGRGTADAEALRQAVEWLLEGERPLLYAGHGCRVSGAAEAVRALVEAHGLPTVLSWMSSDLLPGSHPLNFGAPGGLAPLSANQILYGADRILFLGARLDLGTTAFQRDDFGAQAERLIVDVDAAELAKFSGLGRTRTLKADLAVLPGAVAGLAAADHHAAWRSWCEARRADYLAQEAARLDLGRLNVYGVCKAFSDWSDGKTFVPTGSGWAIEAFLRFFRPGQGARLFFGGSLGAMGLGLPQALGASFAAPGRVICVEADGGLMLNVQELATLAHHRPRGFVLFVLNNRGYASISASQDRHFGMRSGSDAGSGVFIPDFSALAPAFGLPYVRIDSLEALEALLPTLSEDAPPVFVDLMIEGEESRGPAVKTLIGPDGKLSSTPLSDIQW